MPSVAESLIEKPSFEIFERSQFNELKQNNYSFRPVSQCASFYKLVNLCLSSVHARIDFLGFTSNRAVQQRTGRPDPLFLLSKFKI